MTYEQWDALYAPVEAQYDIMKHKATRFIYDCIAEPHGYIKRPMLRFTKLPERNCFSWHQVYHSMAMSDANMAVQILMNMFPNQDEFGELPDLITEDYINITATKPPIHGLGALWLMERAGDFIARAQYEEMYRGFEKLYIFWTTLRDTDGDGVPQYNHGCESGYDFSLMFAKGVPVETPDIISYVALLAEALGEIAAKLGNTDSEQMWLDRERKLLDALFTKFWNGERFIAKLSGLHETVEFEGLEAYFPFMLGKRLPQHIADKMAQDLKSRYATPFGLRSMPKSGQSPVSGTIMGFSQVKILPGLYAAGQKKLAVELLRGFVNHGAENEPAFFFNDDGTSVDMGDFAKMSALSAAEWLICAQFLQEVVK
jgi:hypothetical protein